MWTAIFPKLLLLANYISLLDSFFEEVCSSRPLSAIGLKELKCYARWPLTGETGNEEPAEMSARFDKLTAECTFSPLRGVFPPVTLVEEE